MTPDEEAKANRQGSFLLRFRLCGQKNLCKWTEKFWDLCHAFRKVKEKEKELHVVRKMSTSVQGWRLKEMEWAENGNKILIECRYGQNVCAP